MKRLLNIAATFVIVLVFNILIINPVSAKPSVNSNNGGSVIPESVMKIAERSCVKCHSVPGNHMALSMLNLTSWDKLSPEKQAAKAKKMCNIVTKNGMPPKKFRKTNPNDGPTKEEVTIICDWAQSLQVDKK
jgi:hypothetical protein